MHIGIPTEIKDNEYRVGATPAGVQEFVHAGHIVLVQAGAGLGSGIPDEAYQEAGAKIVATANEAWSTDLVCKVKEPLPAEYGFLRPELTLFTYLHLASQPELVKVLCGSGCTAIGYETVQLTNGALPLLAPMSQVAGKMATQVGAGFLQREHGGKGMLLGGVPGTRHGTVFILGGGNVGINAAKVAAGMGARVIIADNNPDRLTYIDDIFRGQIVTLMSTRRHIFELLPETDVLIGAALIPGARAPQLLAREQLKMMQPGSVLVDVAIDQGGMSETSRATSHSKPVYTEEGVIHYCVPNIPGSVPMTSTSALTNATLPYALKLAAGVDAAVKTDPALALGVNIRAGKIVHPEVAREVNNFE